MPGTVLWYWEHADGQDTSYPHGGQSPGEGEVKQEACKAWVSVVCEGGAGHGETPMVGASNQAQSTGSSHISVNYKEAKSCRTVARGCCPAG